MASSLPARTHSPHSLARSPPFPPRFSAALMCTAQCLAVRPGGVALRSLKQ